MRILNAGATDTTSVCGGSVIETVGQNTLLCPPQSPAWLSKEIVSKVTRHWFRSQDGNRCRSSEFVSQKTCLDQSSYWKRVFWCGVRKNKLSQSRDSKSFDFGGQINTNIRPESRLYSVIRVIRPIELCFIDARMYPNPCLQVSDTLSVAATLDRPLNRPCLELGTSVSRDIFSK